MATNLTKTSKFLSLVLRHDPGAIGLKLDAQGWADVEELVWLLNANKCPIDRATLDRVVAENDKKRFAFSDDGKQIRANQGHSVEVDLALPLREPPEFLFHGTAEKSLASIRSTGLHSASRQHVHLSLDEATATKVGQRHGKPVVLRVRSGDMHRAGIQFFVSDNGVWLTESVPVEYLIFS